MAHEEVLNLILRLSVHMFEAETVPNMAIIGKHQAVLRTLDEIVAYVPGEMCAETHQNEVVDRAGRFLVDDFSYGLLSNPRPAG